MSTDHSTAILTLTTEKLSREESLKGIFHQHRDGNPLPSAKALQEIIELSRSILFPGYYGMSSVNIKTIKYHIGVNVERLHKLLTDQIMAGLCFADECREETYEKLARRQSESEQLAAQLVERLPEIRATLATDVEAAYYGDPAAEGVGEIISCYPVIKALTNYRIAHELMVLGVPLIPRMMTEMPCGGHRHRAGYGSAHGRKDCGQLRFYGVREAGTDARSVGSAVSQARRCQLRRQHDSRKLGFLVQLCQSQLVRPGTL